MGAAIAAMLPSLLVVVLTLHEAGKIIGESFGYIARNFVPAIYWIFVYGRFYLGLAGCCGGFISYCQVSCFRLCWRGGLCGYLWLRNREIFYEVKGLVGRK